MRNLAALLQEKIMARQSPSTGHCQPPCHRIGAASCPPSAPPERQRAPRRQAPAGPPPAILFLEERRVRRRFSFLLHIETRTTFRAVGSFVFLVIFTPRKSFTPECSPDLENRSSFGGFRAPAHSALTASRKNQSSLSQKRAAHSKEKSIISRPVYW